MRLHETLPGPLDPDDPVLAPIAGIDLARFAQLTRAIARYGFAGVDDVEAYVQRAGHSAEAWREAHAGWTARFRADMRVALQYAEHFNETPH